MKHILLTGILLGFLSLVILPARIPPELQLSREWVLAVTPTSFSGSTISEETVGFLLPEWMGFFTEDGRMVRAEQRLPHMVVSNHSMLHFDEGAEVMVVLGIDGRPQFRMEGRGHPFFADDTLYVLRQNFLSLTWIEDESIRRLKVNTPLQFFAEGDSFSMIATMLGDIYPLDTTPPFSVEPPLSSLAVASGGTRVFVINGETEHHARIFSLREEGWVQKTSMPLTLTVQNTIPSVFLSEDEVLFATPQEMVYFNASGTRHTRSVDTSTVALYTVEGKGIVVSTIKDQWYLTLWQIPLQKIFHEPLSVKPSFFYVEEEFFYLGFDSTLLKFRIFDE